MDSAAKEGPLDKIFDSMADKLGIENLGIVDMIYRFPNVGNPILHINNHTKEKDFKPWYYSPTLLTEPKDIKMIPASNTRFAIHFLPPSATEAAKKKTDDLQWFENKSITASSFSMKNEYIGAFVDLLRNIKNGNLQKVDYIIGQTNYKMANFAVMLGFNRCWEDGYLPPADLGKRMSNEGRDYYIGVSVSELADKYDLNNQ